MPAMLFSMIHHDPLKSRPNAKNPCQKSIHSAPHHLSLRLYTVSLVPKLPKPSPLCLDAYLDGILPLGKVSRPLLRLQQGLLALVLAQASSDGTGLLWSEVEGEVFLVLVEQSELGSLVGVDDCENFGDRLSDIMAIEAVQLVIRISLSMELWMVPKSPARIEGSFTQGDTHILVSFDAEPPAIFCVRSWPSSVFNSPSCFARSVLLLDHRAPVLTFDVDCRIVD